MRWCKKRGSSGKERGHQLSMPFNAHSQKLLFGIFRVFFFNEHLNTINCPLSAPTMKTSFGHF